MEEAGNFGEAHRSLEFRHSVHLAQWHFCGGTSPGRSVGLAIVTEIEERTLSRRMEGRLPVRVPGGIGKRRRGVEQRLEGMDGSPLEATAARAAESWGRLAALERSVIGFAWLGRKEEAAALRPLTEELLLTGVWVSLDLSPFRTAAGIAAACAGDWSAAEQHHLTAIHQTDTAPYRVSQPMAREWYATMLLDRNAPGDAAKARGLLSEALAMYESMGMPFHAKRTSARTAPAGVIG